MPTADGKVAVFIPAIRRWLPEEQLLGGRCTPKLHLDLQGLCNIGTVSGVVECAESLLAELLPIAHLAVAVSLFFVSGVTHRHRRFRQVRRCRDDISRVGKRHGFVWGGVYMFEWCFEDVTCTLSVHVDVIGGGSDIQRCQSGSPWRPVARSRMMLGAVEQRKEPCASDRRF